MSILRRLGQRLNLSTAAPSVNRRIFFATIAIGAALVIVKVAAMFREVLVARAFGLSDDVDAFLIAFVVPSFFVNVIAGSFNAAFLPVFVRLREKNGHSAASQLLANIIIIDFCLLAAVTVALIAVGPSLLTFIAGHFSGTKLRLAFDIYYWLLPSIVLQGLITILGSVLNAGEKFGLAALSPILTPLAVIAVVAMFGNAFGGRSLAWGTTIGMLLELAFLGCVLKYRSDLPRIAWGGYDAPTRAVMKQYLPMISGAALTCASSIVDQGMAAWLSPGSVAALNYAGKLPALISGIGVTALGTAVLPYFSKLAALRDFAALKHTLRTYCALILAATIPITIGLIIGSNFIVRLMFQRGAFHPEDTDLVASIQQMYLIQTPFYVLGIIGVRVLSALSKNHVLVVVALLNLTLNFVGNLVFMKMYGVKGIALSSAVVYIFAMILIGIFVYRALRDA